MSKMFSSLPPKTRCLLWTAIIGFFLTVFSLIFALILLPLIINVFLREFLVIQNGTMAWDNFMEMPFPLDFNVYFMITENHEQVLNGSKPFITELGPFVYKNYRWKTDVEFIDDEYITYRNLQSFEFDEVRSAYPHDYEINGLNIIIFGIFQLLENAEVIFPYVIEDILPDIMADYDLFHRVKVNTILFDGVYICNKADSKLLSKVICLVVMLLNIKMIEYYDDLTMSYSLFRYRNTTDDGKWVINTGINDISQLGKVYSWDDMQFTKVYQEENSVCNEINGYDLGVFPPNVEKTTFDIYSTDICRTISMQYRKEDTTKGIDVFKFAMGKDTWRPENNVCANDSCYCSHYTRGLDGKESCFLDGVIDTFPCLGLPALISFPHYLYADEKYTQNIDNLNPREDLHQPYMNVQPLIGSPLEAYINLQMNIICRPMELGGHKINMTQNLLNFSMPLLWMQQGIQVSGELFDFAKLGVTLITVMEILKWIFVVISALIFLCAVANLLVGQR